MKRVFLLLLIGLAALPLAAQRNTQEEIAACIVVDSDEEFDAQALLKFLKPRLSYFKIPKYIFTFRELPMTASGKVRLGELKEIAARNAADTAGLDAVGTTGNYSKRIQ